MTTSHRRMLRLLAICLAGLAQPLFAAETVTVHAAASLDKALNEIATAWRSNHDIELRFSFAGSGTLARQIEAGAPARIFASADKPWMDYVAKRGLIENASRRDLLGNTLVLIAPKDSSYAFDLKRGGDLPASFTGKLCTGDTASVPVGLYAKEALQTLGWWAGLEKRIVGTEDVRTALAFVERGECPLGIVYLTDANISGKVKVIGAFPPDSHKPIVYPFALLKKATPAARDFFRFLESDTARDTFRRYGFAIVPR